MLYELYKLTNSFYYWLITSVVSLITIFYKLFMIFYKKTLSYNKSLLAKDIATKKSNIYNIYQLSKELGNNKFEYKLLEKNIINEHLLRKLENKKWSYLPNNHQKSFKTE